MTVGGSGGSRWFRTAVVPDRGGSGPRWFRTGVDEEEPMRKHVPRTDSRFGQISDITVLCLVTAKSTPVRISGCRGEPRA